MSLESTLHRKITQYEWVTASTTVAPSYASTSVVPGQSFATDSANSVVTAHAGQCTTPLQKELYDMAIACSEKKVYMVGGYDPHTHLLVRQVVEWDLHTRQWTRLCDIPEALSQATAIAFEDCCLVWGGWNGTCYSNKLWLLAPETKNENAASGLPPAHAAPPVAPSSHHPSSSGGRSHKDANVTVAMHWEQLRTPSSSPASATTSGKTHPVRMSQYDADKGTGRQTRSRVAEEACLSSVGGGPPGRCGHAMVLAMMPATLPGSSPMGAAPKLHTRTSSVVRATAGNAGGSGTSSTGPAAAAAPADDDDVSELLNGTGEATASAVAEPVVYLFGGFDGHARRNDVWRLWLRPTLKRREAVWERVEVCAGTAPSPRDHAALAFDMYEDRLVVFGGFGSTLMNDVWVLDLRGEGRCAWQPVPVLGLPSRREAGLAMVFEGGNLIVCMGRGAHRECFAELVLISLQDMRCSLVSIDAASKELLAGRQGYVGCCGAMRGRRMIIYGGGDVQCYRSSIVEMEFDRADASYKKSGVLR